MEGFAKAQAIQYTSGDNTWWCDKKNRKSPCSREVLQKYILEFKPQVLVGLGGVGGMFNAAVLGNMKKVNYDDPPDGQKLRPIIFALSNPKDNAECTAKEAYE